MPIILQPNKGISIFDEERNRMIYYKNPYGVKAKKAYKRLIDYGTPAEFILPPGSKTPPTVVY